MKFALRAHRPIVAVVVVAVAVVVAALLADKVVPLDMQPTLPPRPWPVVEIVAVLAYTALFHLSCSRVFPFDAHAPRSRSVRFFEALVPLLIALGLSLFGAWRLQLSQTGPIQWQTIIVNVALVAGTMLILAEVLRMETAIGVTLLIYFGLVLIQTGSDPTIRAMLPIARMTGPGPWFVAWLVAVALLTTTIGVFLRTLYTPTRLRASETL